ncbi:MAG: DUF4398 domain-containing protein [Myxococcota bacterium]
MHETTTTRLLWLAMVLVALIGCGPTQSTILINESEVALEKATLVDAEDKAPFEYYSASQYLHKAKEEWGYSNFEKSAEFAILAKKFSEEALRKAKGISSEDQAEPRPPGAAKPNDTKPKNTTRRRTRQPSSDPDADALESIE